MRPVRPVLIPCILALAPACSQAIRTGPEAISAIAAPASAAFDSAYRRGDADAVVDLMTDSVTLSAEGVPDVTGRAAIRDLLLQLFAADTVEHFTLQPTELRVFKDHAFERGTFLWSAGPRGGVMTQRDGRYTLLRLRGDDGTWRIHRYQENCLPAPCP